MIPTQVFLDKNGREFHRHMGFYGYEEIAPVLKKAGHIEGIRWKRTSSVIVLDTRKRTLSGMSWKTKALHQSWKGY